MLARTKPVLNADTLADTDTVVSLNNEAPLELATSGGVADVSATRTTARFIAIAKPSTRSSWPASANTKMPWLMTAARPRMIEYSAMTRPRMSLGVLLLIHASAIAVTAATAAPIVKRRIAHTVTA